MYSTVVERPARLTELWIVLAAAWALLLLRPESYFFGSPFYLEDALGFPATVGFMDFFRVSSSEWIYHGPLNQLLLVPIVRLPGPPLVHLMVWAAMLGLAPALLWVGLRREAPLAALPLALALVASPALTIGARNFNSPGFLPLFVAAGIGPLLRGFRTGEPRALMLAGLCFGLGAGCHASGIFLAPVLLAAAWPHRRRLKFLAGPAVHAVLCLPLLAPVFRGAQGEGWVEMPFQLSITTSTTHLLNALLGGLGPVVMLILLARWRSGRPPLLPTPWVHPAWCLAVLGALPIVALTVLPQHLFPHYFLFGVLGLALLAMPRNHFERLLATGVYGAAVVTQVLVLLVWPMDQQPQRYAYFSEAADEICAGERLLPDPDDTDESPVLLIVEYRCPEQLSNE